MKRLSEAVGGRRSAVGCDRAWGVRPTSDRRPPTAVRVLGVLIIVALTACSSSYQLLEVQDSDFLYFGTARPAGVVTDAEWDTFVAEVIQPRFSGFTQWKAVGHWEQTKETTHVVQLVHLHRGEYDRKVAEVIDEYKRRFDQQSVFWVRTPALAQER